MMTSSDLLTKLEPAFLSGLRCINPETRKLFYEVFNSSIERRLYPRLAYIACMQNWEQISNQYWITQCLEVGPRPLIPWSLTLCCYSSS